jgi:hypothetical protein
MVIKIDYENIHRIFSNFNERLIYYYIIAYHIYVYIMLYKIYTFNK